MFEPDFDASEWDFLPPLDDADLPPAPRFDHQSDDHGYKAGDGEFAALDAVGRLDALIALDRQLCALEARKRELLAVIADLDSTRHHWSVEEVGAALRLSGGATRGRLAGAQQLVHHLPATLAQLRDGQLSPDHAEAIVRGSYRLPDSMLPKFEERVLARAGEQTVPGLKQSVARAVVALDPGRAEQRHQRALADRSVRIASGDDGMAWLMALLPAEDAHAIYARLDSAARAAVAGAADDDRTLEQRRADLLVATVLHAEKAEKAELPTWQGRSPVVEVVVPLTSLVGTSDEPAWLTGFGPITAEQARRIAHDPTGTWRRLLTDPVTGRPLDYGTSRYRPPSHLVDHVISRDGTCAFPYCDHAARRSDLDHVIPFPDGPTSADNLQALHRRHHNAKTEGGWSVAGVDESGRTTWISPQGRTYHSRPPQRWTEPDDPPF